MVKTDSQFFLHSPRVTKLSAMSLQISLQYATAQSAILVHESLKPLREAHNYGVQIANTISKFSTTKAHLYSVNEDIQILSDLKNKMTLYRNGLNHNRKRRHILTPIIASLTGLASAKTTTQLKNMLQDVNLDLQKNHLITDILYKNQELLKDSINQSLQTINSMNSKMENVVKNTRDSFHAISAANNFRKLVAQTTLHYQSILRLNSNHMEIFNILDAQHLIEIEKSLANHAEANSGSHSKSSLIGIFKTAEMEIITGENDEILIAYIIPLIDSQKFHIEAFYDNNLILQTKVDQETFTIANPTTINHINSNNIILTDRPIFHFRKSRSWKKNFETAQKSMLIENTLLVTHGPTGIMKISCNNGSQGILESNSAIVAVFIPQDCSISTNSLKIKKYPYNAKIDISQDLQIKKLVHDSSSVKAYPDIHKDLHLMNLTAFPTFQKSYNKYSTTQIELSDMNWLIILTSTTCIAMTPWLIILIIHGCYNKAN